MTIAEVLSKITAGDELTDEEKAFLSDYKEPDLAAAEAKAGATSRKKLKDAEAKLAEMAAKVEELTEQVEEAEGGKSTDLEKLQKAQAKLQAKLEKAESHAKELEAQNAKIHRDHAFSTVLGTVNFVDEQSRQAGTLLLQQALADVEDLSDADSVAPIVSEFKTNFTRLIAAEGKGGTGAPPNAGGGKAGTPKKGLTPDDIRNMSDEDFQKSMQDGSLWSAGAQEG